MKTLRKVATSLKAVAALVGSLLTAVVALVPADWAGPVAVIIALCTAVGTWAIPNLPTTPPAGD